MVIFLPESEGKLVCCRAIGKLTDQDLHNLMLRIEQILETHGSSLIYIDLEFFKGWEWQAAWEKKILEKKDWDQIEKIAFVGSKKWEQIITNISKNLKNVDRRYFSNFQHSMAIEWIKK